MATLFFFFMRKTPPERDFSPKRVTARSISRTAMPSPSSESLHFASHGALHPAETTFGKITAFSYSPSAFLKSPSAAAASIALASNFKGQAAEQKAGWS